MSRARSIFAFFAVMIAVSSVPRGTYGQESRLERKEGTVSFITTQNLYARFRSTDGVVVGDTVYAAGPNRFVPVMVVKHLSSESCAGQIIGIKRMKVGDRVYVYVLAGSPQPSASRAQPAKSDSSLEGTISAGPSHSGESNFGSVTSPRIHGGITANSYSNFSNFAGGTGIQRWNYSLNLNAKNILRTGVSLSSYMNYSYLGSEWKDVAANPFVSLRVYELAAKYNSGDLEIWAGRHIGRSISGVGPVDGLQVQEGFGRFAAGAVIGSRPDFYNLGYNPRLFEYGGYISRTDTLGQGTMQNTVGVFQQYNNMNTDRRFIYFQHTSNPVDEFSFFLTGQVDLFKIETGSPRGDLSLTDLYFSTLYTPVNRFSISLSYSAQRNTIYYETFGTSIDSLLLAENRLRHNVRLGFILRPIDNMFVNLGGGYSFQQGDISPTRNFGVSVTQSHIPFLGVSATGSYDRTLSGYLDGTVYGLRLSKYLTFNSTTISAGFTRLSYAFGSGNGRLLQSQASVDLNTRVLDKLYLNIYYQGIFSGSTTYGTSMGGFSYRF